MIMSFIMRSRRPDLDEATRQGFHLYDECFDDDGNVS